MFEEQIAQGRSMLQRLEAESRLTNWEREALPAWKRVPMKEAQEWHRIIEDKLKANYGPETYGRYQLAQDFFNEAIRKGEGDYYSRPRDYWERVLTLLSELDAREVSTAPQAVVDR